jgi:hypothetical protein
MPIVLVPNFCRELVESLARDIAVVSVEFIKPNCQFVTLALWKCKDVFLQFSKTHLT